ncbi:MAG: substrate-binding domain-containing protein [Lachnospiraceae bacterium]|nr:substrate-binding domain-containing protein [Lachnospiraceae bacterium]
MKKWIALLLVAAMTCSLVACGSSSSSSTETEEETAVEEEADTAEEAAEETAETTSGGGYVIGFSNYNNEISWKLQFETEFTYMADTLKDEGVISDYYVYEANGDQAKQISDINDLITLGVDAIVVTAITSDGLNDVLQEAMDEGIIVVNCDNLTSADVSAKIVVSDYNHGYVSGTWLGEQLIANGTEEGNVIVLRGQAGTSTDANRYQGGVDALQELCPNVNIIAEEACDWDYATAKTALETLLATYSQIDGVLSQGGAMTQAAIDAFNEAGRELVPMTGEGGNGFMRVWLENSEDGFESMAFYNPAFSSRIALECAIALLDGGTIDDCASLISENYDVEPTVEGTELQLSFDSISLEDAEELYDSTLNDDFWPGTYLPHDVLEELFPATE